MVLLQHAIDECWKASELIFNGQSAAPMLAPGTDPAFMSYMVLGCVMLFLVFIKSERIAFPLSFQAIYLRTTIDDIYGNQNLRNAFNITSIVCYPIIALMLYRSGIFSQGLARILIALPLFMLLRTFLQSYAVWLRGGADAMSAIRNSSQVYFVALTAATLPVFAIVYLFPSSVGGFAKYYVILVFAIVYSIYLLTSRKIIMQSDCSLFFRILYLCALELVPFGLLISVLH